MAAPARKPVLAGLCPTVPPKTHIRLCVRARAQRARFSFYFLSSHLYRRFFSGTVGQQPRHENAVLRAVAQTFTDVNRTLTGHWRSGS